MARTAAWTMLTVESGLSRYLSEIKRFPMLGPQEEYMVAKRWCEHDDREAAHKLVTSHLRLVARSRWAIAVAACRSARSFPRGTSA
jgi:RNA polymerase sigma-32 factor